MKKNHNKVNRSVKSFNKMFINLIVLFIIELRLTHVSPKNTNTVCYTLF